MCGLTRSSVSEVANNYPRKPEESPNKNGYAFSFEERVVGISTVAVPIADHTGQVIAALSVTGPNSRVGRKQLLEFVPHAQDAAGRISASLGFTGDSLPPAATPTS
ncbi:MAG: IclR family transcriptional regulator domain-containing protein [Gammaproteobacteria bacterium]